MTTDEVREYLKSYKIYKDRIEYINNKVLNVHSIKAIGRTSEPKNQNDYILMKEECKKEMENIRNTIDKVTTLKYRMALYYRYVDGLTQYDIADIMGKSVGTVWHYFHKGIAELANILE
jgi:DNA-directed RNA polymerase specialized sigma24 family protein